MPVQRPIEWLIRFLAFGGFLAHAVFLLQTKESWVIWFTVITSGAELALWLTFTAVVIDVAAALLMLVLPTRIFCLFAAFWAALVLVIRPVPFSGRPAPFEFLEHSGFWALPLVLLLLRGWPEKWRDFLA